MLISLLQSTLRILAKIILKKYHPDVVGITGSIGKSSTKEAVAVVLKTKFNVRASAKNYNNQIGLPLTVIGVEKTPGKSPLGWLVVFGKALKLIFSRDRNYPEILILEMGADRPGDIQYLVEIAPCKVGVLTYISNVHTEFFKTIKKIAQEKRTILSHLNEDDFAVVNFDNDLVMQNAKSKAETLTYGFKEGSDFQATDVNIIIDQNTSWPTGLNFKVNHDGSFIPVFMPGVMAEHLVSTVLAGLAVGHIFGVNLVDAVNSLRGLNPLPGHMRILRGIKDTFIIDDTYNSSPEPVKSALQTLSQVKIKDGAERYAVLGDMLELGQETEFAHRQIGFRVAELGIDVLITVGEASKHTAQAAREAGMDEHKVLMFDDTKSVSHFLQEVLEKGDVVLLKGSQSVRMERVVKEIMAEPLRAKELLARQDADWLKK